MNLAQYDNSHYQPGAGVIKRVLWYVINAVLFDSWLWPESRFKAAVLRAFGAKVGRAPMIKPRVNIKYPWNLELGDRVWLGEGVWIDSLVRVKIGSDVCISQEAYLVTGNHDYRDPAFGLVVKEICIEDGVWVGARAVVCPGVRLRRHAVVAAGSVMSGEAEEAGVYRGNPAQWVRRRYSASSGARPGAAA